MYKKIEIESDYLQPGTTAYQKGGLHILISPPHAQLGWHMSISTPYRNPTWEEIRAAWYNLIPDAYKRHGAMFFPLINEYVNTHKFCFHIHEVKENAKLFNEEKN